MKYPDIKEIVEKVHVFTQKVLLIEAMQLAKKAGSSLTKNIVLLGALAGTKRLPVKTQSVREAVVELVPPKHVDVNLKAFQLGLESVEEGSQRI